MVMVQLKLGVSKYEDMTVVQTVWVTEFLDFLQLRADDQTGEMVVLM